MFHTFATFFHKLWNLTPRAQLRMLNALFVASSTSRKRRSMDLLQPTRSFVSIDCLLKIKGKLNLTSCWIAENHYSRDAISISCSLSSESERTLPLEFVMLNDSTNWSTNCATLSTWMHSLKHQAHFGKNFPSAWTGCIGGFNATSRVSVISNKVWCWSSQNV